MEELKLIKRDLKGFLEFHIRNHRNNIFIACSEDCWCWKLEDLIKSYYCEDEK